MITRWMIQVPAIGLPAAADAVPTLKKMPALGELDTVESAISRAYREQRRTGFP